MQNIQDLKDKIFSESRDIIGILGGINHVDELISRQDLLNDLAEKISFLKMLDKNLNTYAQETPEFAEDNRNDTPVYQNPVTEEEEKIFNNEANFAENFTEQENNTDNEEEAIFNNQLSEIIESEYHENIVHFVEENEIEEPSEYISEETKEEFQEEMDFVNQNQEENETADEEPETSDSVLSFVDEEKILENAEPENDDDFSEEFYHQEITEEETVFNEQLNEIAEEEVKESENHIIPDIFESEFNEDEMLVEETENEEVSSSFNSNQEELITESSNVETILSEIKKDSETETPNEENEVKAEDSARRKIVDIDKPEPQNTKEIAPSDESFENLEAYREEKKIKLAHIRGLKSIQTLFDDDPLEKEVPQIVAKPTEKEDSGSILKTNIPTGFMEAEKQRPEFRLDLNDRLAFTKVLFSGSQTDLNNAISELNRCKNLDEAKEYLSDLYYAKKWDKVDEYAQRLWILVENKFI